MDVWRKKLIVDTFAWNFWKFFVGSATAILGIIFGVDRVLKLSNLEVSLYITVALLVCILLLRFITFVSIHAYTTWLKKRHESVYLFAITRLNDAFARAHWLRKHDEYSEKKLNETMRHMCHQLKLIFDMKTKKICTVSIKVPVFDETLDQEVAYDTKIRNLSRDKSSVFKRDTVLYKETTHQIFKNTCFHEIFEKLTNNSNEKLYYLNNDIKNTKNYLNTSFACWENNELPYNSEIVVPIIPLYSDREHLYKVTGFICVDCPDSNVFDEGYDVAVLQGVADGIYEFLKPNMPKIKTPKEQIS